MTHIFAPTTENILTAAQALSSGRLVGIPTETVYGLAADARNFDAVTKVYSTKGRPSNNPLIVHVVDLKQAQKYGHLDEIALQLAAAFWPGPLTLVVPCVVGSDLANVTTAGLSTVALRIPSHLVAQALLKEAGMPLAAPSANLSTCLSPTCAQDVAEAFADKTEPAMILDGGACQVGLESTIISVLDSGIRVLRPGGIAIDEIADVIGHMPNLGPSKEEVSKKPMSPGLFGRHYAPKKPLRLNVTTPPKEGEAFLAFGSQEYEGEYTLNLSKTADLCAAAHNLFAYLRILDHSPCQSIAVAPIPLKGLGLAINDRLQRAQQS